jgi:hypothetical protein
MKKLLVVLLALTVLGGFMAFADDAAAAPTMTISGSGQTGVRFTGGNGSSFSGQLWSTNNGTVGDGWIDLTYGGASAGGKIELYVSNGAGSEAANTNPTNPVGIDVLAGWWKPISMLKINAGYGYGNFWSTPIEGWSNYGTGFNVILTPIDGLNVAAEYNVTSTVTALDLSKQLDVAASYALASLGTFGLDYGFGGLFIAGANVTAVPNLTAQVDFKFNTSTSKYRAEEQVAYAIDVMKPGVWAYESSIAGDAAWGVKPWFEYTMAPATLGVYFQYNADATWAAGPYAKLTVDKNAMKFYADYKSTSAFDFGFRYVVSF